MLLSGCNRVPTRFIVVTTFADGRDAAPGNGICEVTPGQGDCSLRAAIDEVNLTTAPVNSNATASTGVGVVIGAATNYFGLPLPTATIIRSTITENAPTGPPELALFAAHGSITVSGSIIQASGYDCGGAVSSAGFNVFTDSSCASAATGTARWSIRCSGR